MSRARLLVINPNSNLTVTRGLADACRHFDRHPDLSVDCCTLEDAPFGIETDAHIDAVVPLVVDRVRSDVEHDAYVIACYSDPGLAECRDATSKPVFGIQQSALATAVACGARFGVLALSDVSIARHLAYIKILRLESYLAGERALDLSVADAASDPATLGKIIEAGRALIDDAGAEILILGCAGMVAYRRAAEQALGVTVIDPTQAAVALALGILRQANSGVTAAGRSSSGPREIR